MKPIKPICCAMIIMVLSLSVAYSQNPCRPCTNKVRMHLCEGSYCVPCHIKCVYPRMVEKYLADGWLYGGCSCGGNGLAVPPLQGSTPSLTPYPDRNTGQTTLASTLKGAETVSIKVYDKTGRLVNNTMVLK